MGKNTEKLQSIRHSLAHLTAAAVLELYPGTHNAIGPATDNGFYQDFEFPTPLSEKDLKKIEKKMRQLLKSWQAFEGTVLTKEEALETFKHNPYKVEMVHDIHERGETITKYVSGDFVDLCRGGHTEDIETLKSVSFKLDRIAGAYWKNDENNKMLTRIYGLAFEEKKELEEFLLQREEARKRDHRKIGKELDLFTFSDLVGPGLPLWTPKGTLMTDLIMEKIENIQKRYGYQKVRIPHITKKNLYETSGHWEKFGDELFKVYGKNEGEFVLKPMNCPHHTQIFASNPRSYRDMPLRYMELGVVYRDEQAGELSGLSRVRSISMDDGHVFCRPDQIEEEIKIIVNVIKEFYNSFDMLKKGEYWVSLSVRDSKTPEKYLGDDSIWNLSEETLEKIAIEENLEYKKVEGEAAFYGPKLDFMFKDALGRERQLGTAQLDFNMPKRFELEYTDKDGKKKTPVMIHRAVAGSMERFLSVMIEHFAGAFPVWLSPTQIAIIPVSGAHKEYAKKVSEELKGAGIRTDFLSATDSLGKRIRNTKKEKTPYWIVIGDKETESKTLTLENRNEEKTENITVSEISKKISQK